MKVGVCEVEWEEEVGKGGEEEAAVREGCGAGEGGGDGKVFIARGAGRPDCSATEMLSAAWLPPKDSASFPPNPPPPSVHLAPVSPLSALPPLFPSLPSLLLLYLLSFTLQLLLLGLFFFLHFSHFLSFSPAPHLPHSTSGPLQTLSNGLRRGGGGCGGWMERLRGAQKAWDAVARREWLALKRSRAAS